MSSVGYTRFTAQDDAFLREMAEDGVPLAEQAYVLNRPVGSIKSRRRILGLSGSRKPEPVSPMQYEHEPTLTAVAVLMCFVLFGIGLTILGEL